MDADIGMRLGCVWCTARVYIFIFDIFIFEVWIVRLLGYLLIIILGKSYWLVKAAGKITNTTDVLS